MPFKEIKTNKPITIDTGEPTITLGGGFPCSAIYISVSLARKAKIRGGDVFRVTADKKKKKIKLVRVAKRCKPESTCVIASHADGIVAVDGFRRLKVMMRRQFLSMKIGYKSPVRIPASIQDGNKIIIFSYNERDRICQKKKKK